MVIKEKVEFNSICSNGCLGKNGCIFQENELIESMNSNNEESKTGTYDNDWIYVFSHELRTPLNVILSTIQVSKLNNIGEYSKVKTRYLDIMKQNCLRLLKMVNKILDINRLDSGFFGVDLKNEDIVCTIKDITLSVIDYAEMKNLELTFESNKPEYIVCIDSFQLERIILNLLSNAIKYTPVGGDIKVTVNIQDKNIFVSVSDTGPGIPSEYHNTIFEKCNQTDGKSLLEKKGSGMGLYIAKRLLENMGGEIFAYNNEVKGTTIVFSIPNKKLPQTMKEPPTKEYYKSRAEYIEIEFSDIYSN